MQDELYLSFEDYLSGKMTDKEKAEFERILVEDPSALKSFNTYKQANVFLTHKFSNETISFKDNLKSISTDYFTEKATKKGKIIGLKTIFYAVAAVLILFVSLQFFQTNPSFENYNQFENAAITERGEHASENLKKAEIAYNNKKYKEAIPLFELVMKEVKTPEIQYFYGICLLQESQIVAAEKVFINLKANPLYKDNAIWCLALAKLKLKDYTACKALILEISTDADCYKVSRELLKEL